MVSHRQMGVVRLQGIVGSSEQTAHVEGVVLARVEVCVVANLHGQVHRDLVTSEQTFLLEALVALQDLGVDRLLGKDVLQESPDRPVHGSAQGGKGVQRGLREAGDIKALQ